MILDAFKLLNSTRENRILHYDRQHALPVLQVIKLVGTFLPPGSGTAASGYSIGDYLPIQRTLTFRSVDLIGLFDKALISTPTFIF